MTPVRLEPVAPRSLVKHSTTEPPRCQQMTKKSLLAKKEFLEMMLSTSNLKAVGSFLIMDKQVLSVPHC